MKTLSKLEKSKPFWVILSICVAFFFFRFPSLFEPYWYGDEGIYEVIGQALHQGKILYSDIWDNKPPLLYVMFAIFNGNLESVRALSLIFGLVSTIVFFNLCQKLFKNFVSSVTATILFAILFGTPYIEGTIANAENFMLLPIITAGLLIYRLKNHTLTTIRKPLFISGLLLGIAFLFKIVAVFDLIAFVLFIIVAVLPSKEDSHTTKLHKHNKYLNFLQTIGMTIGLGFIIPLLITMLYFLFQGALKDFIHATFFGNISYVGYNNILFGIPQGLLLFKLMLLGIAISLIFIKRHALSKPALFVLLWLTFSLFSAFFSQRPWTHYLLVLLPSICLLVGLIIETKITKIRLVFIAILIAIIALVKANFWISTFEYTALYYQNIVLFITGQKDVQSYRSFFDKRTPRDYELASFITKHTNESDTVYIWGDSAQIYALAHKQPINKYTVAYHIIENNKAMEETQRQLRITQPKYIITLSETPPFPFSVHFYSIRFTNTGATIYERNF